jgi:polysaccharide export outer membrane protein
MLPALLHAQAADPIPAGDPLVLQPGDSVRITVWQRPDLSGEFAVASDGSLTHPLYRKVKVAGVPFPSVEAQVGGFLGRFIADPQFVVEPLLHVSVGGEVQKPSSLALRPGTTVAQAVGQAGGLTTNGRRDHVRVIRGGNDIFVNLTRPGATQSEMPIRSGDLIMVEEKPSFFHNVVVPAATILGAAASVVFAVRRYR